MFKYLFKCLLFLIPVGILYAFPLSVIVTGREWIAPEDAAVFQQSHPQAIFGQAYDDTVFWYKQKLVEIRKPEVVALGSSRVIQMRKEFFNQPEQFTNAGVGGASIGDMEEFIRLLGPDSNIKVIIMGLDHVTFYQYDAVAKRQSAAHGSNVITRTVSMLATKMQRIYDDYFMGHKFTFGTLRQEAEKTGSIGVTGLIKHDGYREDGSYAVPSADADPLLSEHVKNSIDARIIEIQKTDTLHKDQFLASKRENEKKLAEVLDLCKEKGITVVAYLAPYSDAVRVAMKDSPSHWSDAVTELPKELNDIYAERGYQFYDLTALDTMGGNEAYFTDDIHGTDMLSAQIVSYIAGKNESIAPYVNSSLLARILRENKEPFIADITSYATTR